MLDQVRRSTVDKAAEIVELRRLTVQRDAARLADCARAMARSFAGEGRCSPSATAAAPPTPRPWPPPSCIRGRAAGPAALSLTDDVAVVTALANDVGFDVVFARQLAAFGRPGDIAVGLSTSGNSDNLVRAFEEASRRGLLTIGLAGYEGGKMAELDTIEYLFVVPSSSVHRIQEAQTTVYHVLWELTQVALAAADGS